MAHEQRARPARRQRSLLIAGLMSGTSLDGIDAVLVRVRGAGSAMRFRQIAYMERPFPAGMRRQLLRNSVPDTSRVDEIARLTMALGLEYAGAVHALARAARVPLASVDLIGSHGQTIHHLPRPARVAGRAIRSTLQIGDPSALAASTGITTVGDFRVADMAVGGQGAPLVPYIDWLLFRSEDVHRLILNIGGIANLTAIPKGAARDDVVAFDTGPGNMVVDALVRRLFGRPFDRDGRIASRGRVSQGLLRLLLRDSFLHTRPPKSTGRERYGEAFVDRLLARVGALGRDDIVATASAFTAAAVHDACRRYVVRTMPVEELIVSGGGARNAFFMSELARLFAPARIRTTGEFGVPADAREAITFALLANETIHGLPANMPRVTGARRPVILGKICPGRNFDTLLFLQS
jgi:anhydro-N-acetylmuramic acid kinase